jgi:hypothetical protein
MFRAECAETSIFQAKVEGHGEQLLLKQGSNVLVAGLQEQLESAVARFCVVVPRQAAARPT